MATQSVATSTAAAFRTSDALTKASYKERRKMTNLGIAQIMAELNDQQKRTKDLLVPYRQLKAVVIETDDSTHENGRKFELGLDVDGQMHPFHVYEPVLGQICTHTMQEDKRTLPLNYLSCMLQDDNDQEMVELAKTNVNAWLKKRANEFHKDRKGKPLKNGERQALVRLLCDDTGRYVVRAILSDRYFVIPNQAIVMAAFSVVTGKDGAQGDKATDSIVRGAQMFDWAQTPFDLNIGFVNPKFVFDLRNPEKGVVEGTLRKDGMFHYAGSAHSYKPGSPAKDQGHHWVMPAAFIKNSETGGGSAAIDQCLMEQYCDNTSVFSAYSKRHSGARMLTIDDYESELTRKKYIELTTSQFADAMRQVFDIKKFEENCLRFLGLFKQEVKNVEETTKWALDQTGCMDLLADVLKSYEQFNQGQDSVGDVQRALTATAQAQTPEKANRLMAFAGDLISGDVKAEARLLVVQA